MKRIVSVCLVVLISVFALFSAEQSWWYGEEIEGFSYTGLKNVQETEIDDALYKYRHATFSDEVFADIQDALYNVQGIDFFVADAQRNETNGLVLAFEFYELPMLSSISFEGNEKVKTSDLRGALLNLAVGSFMDPSRRSAF